MIERLAWVLVVVFVFTIPWEKSVLIPGIGTIARLVGLLALACGLAAAIGRRALRNSRSALATLSSGFRNSAG